MSNCLVSVIIPCYKAERFIAETIESLLQQSHSPVEIIVVDDGSPDNSKDVIARYPSVRYIYQPNQGASAARNHGIRESRGEYLMFLDCDDRLSPTALAVLANELDAHPECGMSFGHFCYIDTEGTALPTPRPAIQPDELVDYQTFLAGQIMLISPGQGLYRRAAIATVGDWNPSLWPSDDYDFQLRVVRSFPVRYLPNHTVLDYRQHGGGAATAAGVKVVLEEALARLADQWPYIRGNSAYEAAYRRGRRHWLNLLGPHLVGEIVVRLKTGKLAAAIAVLWFTLRFYPQGFVHYAQAFVSKQNHRSIVA